MRESLARVICAGGLAKTKFVSANPRNCFWVRVQKSARFARIVCGFAKTIDADVRFVQAHVFRVFSVGPLRHLGARFFRAFSRTLLGPPTGASSARPNARTRPNLPNGWVCAPFGRGSPYHSADRAARRSRGGHCVSHAKYEEESKTKVNDMRENWVELLQRSRAAPNRKRSAKRRTLCALGPCHPSGTFLTPTLSGWHLRGGRRCSTPGGDVGRQEQRCASARTLTNCGSSNGIREGVEF